MAAPQEPTGADDGWVPEPGIGEPDETRTLDDLDLLEELNHPFRTQIMRRLKHPHTVAEVAERLQVPVTRLYHHVNRLESLGFIRVVATRRVAAVTERRYQVSAKSVKIDHDLFDTTDRRELAAALGAIFDTTKLSFQRSVEAGEVEATTTAAENSSFVTSGSVTLSSERRRELIERLAEVIAEFPSDVDEDDPDAHRMEFFLVAFPLVD